MRKTDVSARFRFGALRRGLLAAMAFAVAGVGVLVWVATTRLGVGRGATEEIAPNHAPLGDFTVPSSLDPMFVDGHMPLDSDSAVHEARSAFAAGARQSIEQAESARSLSPNDRAALADAAVAIVAPYLTWDLDQYIQNTSALGAAPHTDESRRQLVSSWQFNQSRLRFESIAPASIEFRRFPGSNEKSLGEDAVYMLELGMVNPQVHWSPGNKVRFPAVINAQDADGPLFEMRVPVILKLTNGESRAALIGVALARNPQTDSWQPLEVRLYHETSENRPSTYEAAQKQALVEPGNLPF